jgi:hypothetical protein
VERTILPGPGGEGAAVIADEELFNAIFSVSCAPAEPEIASSACKAIGFEPLSILLVQLLPSTFS